MNVNDWTIYVQLVQARDQTTAFYVDFSKAFNIVSRNKLFIRLQSYNICGAVLSWLQCFFQGRTHQTKVGCLLSDISFLLSKVIQDNAIGHLMLLFLLSELIAILENTISRSNYLLTMSNCTSKYSMNVDVTKLQSALELWADSWRLSVSVEKCCLLNICKVVIDVNVNVYVNHIF